MEKSVEKRTLITRNIANQLKYSPHITDIPVSYYKVYNIPVSEGKKRQIRVSNHGTYLKTWLGRNYDPTYATNISIVFTENGVPTDDCIVDERTKDKFTDCNPCIIQQETDGIICNPRQIKGINNKKRSFEVVQYVYDCSYLEFEDCNVLSNAIRNAAIKGEYQDPFSKDEFKCAKVMVLKPKDNTDNSNYQMHRIGVKTILNERIFSKNLTKNTINGQEINTTKTDKKLNHQQVCNLLCECYRKLEYKWKKGA